jgi:hypothetical protein
MTNRVEKLETLTNTTEFYALSKLCEDNRGIFSMDASAAFDRLESFSKKFEQTPYVEGLLMWGKPEQANDKSGRLEQAIGKLESECAQITRVPDPSRSPEEIERLKAHKCLERRVRFIHRLAKVIGPSDRPFIILKPGEQNKLQKKVAKSLGQVQKDLRLLLKDEFFQDSLLFGQHRILKRLNRDIENAVKFVAEAKPVYPIERISHEKSARAKVLINRLADVCFRIYGNCDETIINHLTSYPWLDCVAEIADIDALIEQALMRKIHWFKRRVPNQDGDSESSFECRIPNEDSESVELDGEWLPARTLDPPWMEA